MIIIRGIKKIRRFGKPVVALGVFDGVHLGHRKILEETAAKARSINGTSVVLTFWPHPQGEESLYSLEHRLRLIEELGIDVSVVINFNKHFAKIAAANFVENILAKRIGARYIYVGKNFRFGRNAEGDIKVLENAAKIYHFRLKVFHVVSINNKPVSSTLIRALIRRGDLKEAQKLLGRHVSVLGTVIKGISLGRKLGFPTANLDPHHEVIPPPGVYAVRVIYNGKIYKGACYIGYRPTFLNKKARTIEVYIFDFAGNIYGKYLEVQFVKKTREEKKFKTPQDLAQQIKKDLKIVKSHLSLH